MDTGCIDNLAEETAATILPVAAAVEGLKDYQSVNLHPDSQAEVGARLADYQRRRDLLETLRKVLASARAAIEAVLADGHPEVPQREVSDKVLADLDENLSTMTVARGGFRARPLTMGGVLEVGPERPLDR
jgi:predicted flavoprotein YhiN